MTEALFFCLDRKLHFDDKAKAYFHCNLPDNIQLENTCRVTSNKKKQETVFYSRIWNQKGEAVKYETIKQLSKNRQRNYHLQKSASAGE